MRHIEKNRAWLSEKFPDRMITPFQVTAITLLCEALGCLIEDLHATWELVNWHNIEGGIDVPVVKPELSTHRPGTLTKLVALAHDHGVLIQLQTWRFDRLLFVMLPRPVRGRGVDPKRDHPSLTMALQEHMPMPWPTEIGPATFERDAHLNDEQRKLTPAGRYADPRVHFWYRVWEMGVQHGLVAAQARKELSDQSIDTPESRP